MAHKEEEWELLMSKVFTSFSDAIRVEHHACDPSLTMAKMHGPV